MYKLDSNGNEVERIWFSDEDEMKRRVERSFIDNVLVSELFFDSNGNCVEAITVSLIGDYPTGEYKMLYNSNKKHLFKIEEYKDHECVLVRKSMFDGTYTVLEKNGIPKLYYQHSEDLPSVDNEDDIVDGEIYEKIDDNLVACYYYKNGILEKEIVNHCDEDVASEYSPEDAYNDGESYLEEETVYDEIGREIKHFVVRRRDCEYNGEYLQDVVCHGEGTTKLIEYKQDGGKRILTIEGEYIDEETIIDDYESIYDDYSEIDEGFSYEETDGDGQRIVYVEMKKINGNPCIVTQTYRFL
ncbi:MAG: hypothetical protein IK117_11045 [Bacteroidales bacterium]|nr:hypothetical protein [Bacteroidales bacterium]